jgi:hypothetical protein
LLAEYKSGSLLWLSCWRFAMVQPVHFYLPPESRPPMLPLAPGKLAAGITLLRTSLAALLLFVPLHAPAQSCPSTSYTVCLNGNCLCIAAGSGELEAMAARAIQTFDEMRAPVLEAWLLASRNAVFLDAEPLPPAIRAALATHFPAAVLERARYKVGYGDTLNLGHIAMNYGALLNGRTVEAITLVDVILFREDVSDPARLPLWIHELTHVQQYMDWGVRGFAQRYVDDPEGVEAPAYEAEAQANRSALCRTHACP